MSRLKTLTTELNEINVSYELGRANKTDKASWFYTTQKGNLQECQKKAIADFQKKAIQSWSKVRNRFQGLVIKSSIPLPDRPKYLPIATLGVMRAWNATNFLYASISHDGSILSFSLVSSSFSIEGKEKSAGKCLMI
eukprot:Filipodium_phascolosomae@DN6814_c0_g1_i1.p1